jgi:hypothetical protein
MSPPIDQYLADQFGRLNVSTDPQAQVTMSRAFLGSSLVNTLNAPEMGPFLFVQGCRKGH